MPNSEEINAIRVRTTPEEITHCLVELQRIADQYPEVVLIINDRLAGKDKPQITVVTQVFSLPLFTAIIDLPVVKEAIPTHVTAEFESTHSQ